MKETRVGASLRRINRWEKIGMRLMRKRRLWINLIHKTKKPVSGVILLKTRRQDGKVFKNQERTFKSRLNR